MDFLDFADELNYNLKESELNEERKFLDNNRVERVKDSRNRKSNREKAPAKQE